MTGGFEAPTRADVHRWWAGIVVGGCTRGEASAWAGWHLEHAFSGEELILQGLVYLEAVDLGPNPDDGRPHHCGDLPGPHYLSMTQVAVSLERWLAELVVYDQDPDGWDRAWLRGVVSAFTARCGPDRGRAFATKLVKRDHLIEADIERAVGNAKLAHGISINLES